ncbi:MULTISPECIES: hypothetical protein [unclassified Novosphingobium]|uniref:hypothetical protein n=1 Tax=unclassified Novosphingobium TaxID=2644732 RepID=UPI0025D306EC|nr:MULTISPECIES: hypothetical protein [unclassified Novosphingobium]
MIGIPAVMTAATHDNSVTLNSFQGTSLITRRRGDRQHGGTITPLNAPLALRAQWILKQVQDDVAAVSNGGGFWGMKS